MKKKLNDETYTHMDQSYSYELLMILSKRPRESWSSIIPTLLTSSNPKFLFPDTRSADQTKMMLDFKLKIQPDLFNRSHDLVRF